MAADGLRSTVAWSSNQLEEAVAPHGSAWRALPVECCADGLTISSELLTPNLAVLRAVGDIDLCSAPRWLRFLKIAIRDLAASREGFDAASAPQRVVCDISDVQFMSAGGLAVLCETDQRSVAYGATLELVVASRPVHRILELAGLDPTWPTFRSLDDAVA